MQIFYTVRSGDTLNSIALRWSIPLGSLIAANNIPAPYVIYPGQQLSMPPGVNTYVVISGDTLYSISQRYGIPVRRIIEANTIDAPYVIYPGMVLNIPAGMPFYVVRPGDTLYKIAAVYNVTINGQPRPDLIIAANSGLTPAIIPGMTIAIPYPPPGGPGYIAAVMSDGTSSFIQTYEAASGSRDATAVDKADGTSAVFISPDRSKIAYIGVAGVISILEVITKKISKIDQVSPPVFLDWSRDSSKVVYSTGSIIRIYNVVNNTSESIDISGASYVQWFPDGTGLLYEAKDSLGNSQLFRANTDGSDIKQITNSSGWPFNSVRLSPNSRFVLYTSPGASISEIYVLEISTGKTYKIPGGPEAKNYYPVWSPDSSRIAYSSTFFKNGKYYSMIRVSGFQGNGDTTIAISSCYATPLAWSPDSRRVAYLSGCREENIPLEVWSIDIFKPVPMNHISGFFYFNLDW